MATRPTFNRDDTAFKLDLRERVDAYFARTGKARTADAAMVGKTVFFLLAAVGLAAVLVTGVLPALPSLLVAMTLGLVVAGIGFNISHDALHGSYSRSPAVNFTLGALFDVLGASSYNWKRAHNVVHHTFTNVPGTDHDLEPGPFLLLYPRPAPPRIYRWQHVFAFPLYAFTLVVWVFKKDFVQIFDRTMTGRPASRGGAVGMVLGKLVHFSLFLGLPLLVSPWAWWQVLVGYVAMLATAGFTLAIVFQLAHVVEGTTFPTADATNHLREGWASHQLRTTANFSQGSALATFLMGGLNNQVEHHLLPGVCHTHYAALAPIVRECALDHGLPYLVSGNFAQAVAAHTRTLYRLGRPSAALVKPTFTPSPLRGSARPLQSPQTP
jgi:linoleoyl-CoA desaturase